MTMQEQLDQYYECVGISHVAFCCEKQEACRKACLEAWNKKEEFVFEPRAEGVTVSQEYHDGKYHGKRIPRIVVLSLSKRQPSEAESKGSPVGLNKHWPETLAMVRSLLYPFIACEKFPKPGLNKENQKEIEKLFVHVRTAKCCSNAKETEQEPSEVYANCSGYLGKELSILKPDVIVTQGNDAHWGATRHAFNAIEQVKGLDLERPIAYIVNLKEGNQRVYWLRLYHPCARGRLYYDQAGDKIDCEKNVRGWSAMRENFVHYGEAIQDFLGIPNAKGPYPKRLERKESDKGMQSMPEVQATQKPDRLFNTNEKNAPGAYKKMFAQGVIAVYGPWDDPRMLRGSTEGQRVFAYVNKKGILAVGYIVDSEPVHGTTVFGREIEFH